MQGHFDWTRIATGPGSVWVTSFDYGTTNAVNSNAVNGAVVTGLGHVGQWTNFLHLPSTGADQGTNGGTGYGFGDIAVGPTGQVAVVVQNAGAGSVGPTQMRMNVNPYGLSQYSNFSSVWTNGYIHVGIHQLIPAQPDKGIHANPGLAWDRTGGKYRGRLCMVYTDRTNSFNVNDTDIYVIHSDDNGTTWTNAVKVNTDATTTSQFFPRIAVDQASGKVAVSWYDCRGDTMNNEATRLYAAVSSDGGATFSSNNLKLETGQSDAPFITSPTSGCTNATGGIYNYSDYTGLAFYGGSFYSAWADNSNTTTNNPDTRCGMDIYVAKMHY